MLVFKVSEIGTEESLGSDLVVSMISGELSIFEGGGGVDEGVFTAIGEETPCVVIE